jgi:hypothetical protein
VRTAGEPARLEATPDHDTIRNDGRDLSFVTCLWWMPKDRENSHVNDNNAAPSRLPEIAATEAGAPCCIAR